MYGDIITSVKAVLRRVEWEREQRDVTTREQGIVGPSPPRGTKVAITSVTTGRNRGLIELKEANGVMSPEVTTVYTPRGWELRVTHRLRPEDLRRGPHQQNQQRSKDLISTIDTRESKIIHGITEAS